MSAMFRNQKVLDHPSNQQRERAFVSRFAPVSFVEKMYVQARFVSRPLRGRLSNRYYTGRISRHNIISLPFARRTLLRSCILWLTLKILLARQLRFEVLIASQTPRTTETYEELIPSCRRRGTSYPRSILAS